MPEKIEITIYVEGGCVQAVYTTLPKECVVEVELLDFDNAQGDAENPNAYDEAKARLEAVEKDQNQIL
jgi:hypothetical protein